MRGIPLVKLRSSQQKKAQPNTTWRYTRGPTVYFGVFILSGLLWLFGLQAEGASQTFDERRSGVRCELDNQARREVLRVISQAKILMGHSRQRDANKLLDRALEITRDLRYPPGVKDDSGLSISLAYSKYKKGDLHGAAIIKLQTIENRISFFHCGEPR
jgi:hypothetical protein